MSKFNVGDVVVVKERMTLRGAVGFVHLTPGELADVIELEEPEYPHSIRVRGRDSRSSQWIDKSSLTPLEIAEDLVNHPTHYADGWSNGAEVIDITENLNFNRGNAVKYIARAGKKNPDKELEDLQKAEFYLKREIYRLGGDGPADPILERKMADEIVDLDALTPPWEVPADDQFFAEHMSQPLTPRVWDSLAEVPKNVAVFDQAGVYWSWWDLDRKDSYGQTLSSGEWLWSSSNSKPEASSAAKGFKLGPFTESELKDPA